MLLLALFLVSAADNLEALGVVVSPDPARSTTILRLGEKSRVVGLGETVFGAKVTAIGTRSVTVEMDGHSSQIPVRGQPSAPPPPAAKPAETAAPGARSLARADVEKRLGEEMPKILGQTVATAINSGGVRGVALSRIPEGTLLTAAGLEEGDILTEVDGVAIDSLATLMGLYPRLQTASDVQAVVLRKGQPVTLSLSLH